MWAMFNRFELEMTLAEAQGASHQGQCDEDVEALRRTPKIRRQLAKISDEDLQTELREYGAWEEQELQDREANEQRIVWLAAGNIAEDNRAKRR